MVGHLTAKDERPTGVDGREALGARTEVAFAEIEIGEIAGPSNQIAVADPAAREATDETEARMAGLKVEEIRISHLAVITSGRRGERF